MRRDVRFALCLLITTALLGSVHVALHQLGADDDCPGSRSSSGDDFWGRVSSLGRRDCADGLGRHILVGSKKSGEASLQEAAERRPFAYAFYVTEPQYLCNALAQTAALRSLNITPSADIVVLFPREWASPALDASPLKPFQAASLTRRDADLSSLLDSKPVEFFKPGWLDGFNIQGLLGKLRELGAVTKPVQVIVMRAAPVAVPPSYSDMELPADGDSQEAVSEKSLTRLQLWSLTEYDRVVALDSDGMVLQNLDHLFQMPMGQIAMPRAYWLADSGAPEFSTQLMVIRPSQERLKQLLASANESRATDAEVINSFYAAGGRSFPSVTVLPSQFILSSDQLRLPNHTAYLAAGEDGPDAAWNASQAVSEALYVHFYDTALPKPWVYAPMETLKDTAPRRQPELQLWLHLYEVFRRQIQICWKL